MTKVEIYTKSWCPYCARAKDLLVQKSVNYLEIDVTTDAAREMEMVSRSGRHTVPQIFIDGQHLGGSDDLNDAAFDGSLERLLSGKEEGELA